MTKDIASKLLDAGVEFVAGIAYIGHKEVGHWQNGEFYEEPGTEDIVANHMKRVKDERAAIVKNAELAAQAAKPAEATGDVSTVKVPEQATKISVADAATKQNSIPGAGPKNPVRIDGDNNRTAEVTTDTTPVSTEELLRALDNPEGANAVAQGAKQAEGKK